jgi:hypothetical protein
MARGRKKKQKTGQQS